MLKDKIELILKKKGSTLSWAATEVGMTRTGFQRALENETISYKALIKLCEVLNISLAELVENNKKQLSVEQRINALEKAVFPAK